MQNWLILDSTMCIEQKEVGIIMESIWSRTVEIPERDALEGNIKVDAAVIGAGMAGILTAYFLQESGLDTVVLEADRIAGGQTKNTTAKITSQHGLIYSDLIQKYGESRAGLYGEAHEAAIIQYAKLIHKRQIECHFERLPAYVYSVQDREKLMEEAEAAALLGLPASFQEQTKLPFKTVGAVRFDNQAQFHPLEFIRNISDDLVIYEKTRVHSVRGHEIYTDKGKVAAKHIIFTAHYPIINIPGFYFVRQHQERSYVVAYENVKKLNGMYYSIDKDGLSLRSHGDILLAGAGGHRTGENDCGDKYATVRRVAEKYFPEGTETAHWSAQDCMPHDRLPFIGLYSMLRPYWHVATGFQKWGMTSSMLAAMLIHDEIWNMENPYAILFSPQRIHPAASFKNLMEDMGKSIQGLSKGVSLYFGKDKNHRRCSHMGCALNWNEDEQSWDCPCHGSRFTEDGKLLDNPSKKCLHNK